MDPLIPAWVMAMVVGFAIYVQWMQSRYEHVFTRFLFFGFYAALTFYPEIPIEAARFVNRWFFILLFLTEVVSFYFQQRGKRL